MSKQYRPNDNEPSIAEKIAKFRQIQDSSKDQLCPVGELDKNLPQFRVIPPLP